MFVPVRNGLRACPQAVPLLGRPQLKDRDQLSRFNFRQPPARLLAMMFLNMAVGARALMVSPWRMATVRAVALSRRAVMIPSGSGTDGRRHRGRR
jgi:hypothetical protein